MEGLSWSFVSHRKRLEKRDGQCDTVLWSKINVHGEMVELCFSSSSPSLCGGYEYFFYIHVQMFPNEVNFYCKM